MSDLGQGAHKSGDENNAVNPYPAKANIFKFQPPEVVSRYRDSQLPSG